MISIKISQKFGPKVRINNIPALVQIMAWRLTMQQTIVWTNDGSLTDTYMRHLASMSWCYIYGFLPYVVATPLFY